MEYDNLGRHANFGDDTVLQGSAVNDNAYTNGEQPSVEASQNYYEPPVAESTRHGKSKSKPAKPPKKSKSDKHKDNSAETYYNPPVTQQINYDAPVAAQANYDAPVSMQLNYDAPASQHNYYVPPKNESAQIGNDASMEDETDAPPEGGPPPRSSSKAGSKKKTSSSASGFSNLFTSLRRSFSKKKTPATNKNEIAAQQQTEISTEPAMPIAFVNEHEPAGISPTQNEVSPGANALQQPNDEADGNVRLNGSPNRASFVEPSEELVKMRKTNKKAAKDARLISASRQASVENLRDARHKLILANEQSTATGLARAKVILLDGDEVTFTIEKWVNADVLFAKVCDRVNVDVVDQDFFGLTYIQELRLPDPNDKSQKKVLAQKVWFWLDLATPIYKQQRDFSKWEFRFQVKFYPPEPNMMREDLSRYQLCLQLRQDLYYGKLPCSWVVHALLGSYTVQSELGDYEDIAEMHANDAQPDMYSDQPQLPPGVRYIQNFAFLPGQSVELLERIAELHRTHKGLTPGEADVRFLENVKRLPLYGVDLHSVLDASDTEIQLGVSYYGIVVYRAGLLLNKFAWPKIVKVAFKRYSFFVYPRSQGHEEHADEIEFRLADKRLAKRLWTIAVEHHTFWRLKSPESLNRKLNSFARKTLSLLSLSNSSATSTFRFSGRTLSEQRKLKQEADQHDTERDSQSVKFDRLASKRLSASMPHLVNSGRGSQQLSAAPATNRMKAAQSLTSLVLPPPRLGSLRDVTGSSRSVRGSETLPANVNLRVQASTRPQSEAAPPAEAPAPTVPERERKRKPLPTPPSANNQPAPREIVIDEQPATSQSADYSEPVKSKSKRSLSKKDSKKDKDKDKDKDKENMHREGSKKEKSGRKKQSEETEYAPVGGELAEPEYSNGPLRPPERQAENLEPELESESERETPAPAAYSTSSDRLATPSNDDGYEHLRDVASPTPIGDGDSLMRRRSKNKLKVTFSDSETEIDRIPANFGEHLSTLDSDSTDAYANPQLPKPAATVGGVTDLDHHPTAKPAPTYSNSDSALLQKANGNLPHGSQHPDAKLVGETNLDEDESSPHDHPRVPPSADSSLDYAPPLPSTLPPEPSVNYAADDDEDDDDTL